jgi:hypothetical protein
MQEIENNFGEFNFAQTVEEKKTILEELISNNQISEESWASDGSPKTKAVDVKD